MLFRSLEDDIHTQDVKVGTPVGTAAYVDAVLERMGQRSSLASRPHRPINLPDITREQARSHPGSRTKAGVDIFIESELEPTQIAERLKRATAGTPYTLKMISNRGTVVWPSTGGSTGCIDHFRCRFIISDQASWNPESVLGLLQRVGTDFRWMHVEKLEVVDGEPMYTRAQGEN